MNSASETPEDKLANRVASAAVTPSKPAAQTGVQQTIEAADSL